jgi:hypothetical protein
LPYIETFTPRLKTNDQIHIEVVIYTSSQTDHAKLRIRNALAASLAKYLSLRDTTPTFEEALIVIDTSLDALLAEYEIYVCYAELSACYNPLYTAPPPQQPPQPPPTRRRGLLGETHNG